MYIHSTSGQRILTKGRTARPPSERPFPLGSADESTAQTACRSVHPLLQDSRRLCPTERQTHTDRGTSVTRGRMRCGLKYDRDRRCSSAGAEAGSRHWIGDFLPAARVRRLSAGPQPRPPAHLPAARPGAILLRRNERVRRDVVVVVACHAADGSPPLEVPRT